MKTSKPRGGEYPIMIEGVAGALREEAEAVNERRLLVLAGVDADRFEAAERALAGADIDPTETVLIGHRDGLSCKRLEPAHADELLGTTRDAVVVDCHDECSPNALGQVVGCVDGGGLLVLLTPPFASWPSRRDEFDETLAVPPASIDAVGGRFRRRLIATLEAHRGIAIVDIDEGLVHDTGLTDPPPRRPPDPISLPASATFPGPAYGACVTQDQVSAVQAFESLSTANRALVLAADRGRGKSSAAGIAAAGFAADGDDVLVTAPSYENAAAVFERAGELLDRLEVGVGLGDTIDGGPETAVTSDRHLETKNGGRVRFAIPVEAASEATNADVVIVDEAAALPVRLLTDLLAADRIAFTTTVHGYEGTGRGFDVRFRDRLEESRHEILETRLAEPIRHAAGDPIEVWAFRTLLLDASPPATQLVEEAIPENVTYRSLTAEQLVADEHLLREVFGLLVYAHYRTEPNDLARLLDAPNLSVRALSRDDHVVSVALLAREGGLDPDVRQRVYEGGRIRGNMLPDVLMSQLRDEDAGDPVGIRVMRIATHHAVRSRGLGSHLLDRIETEFGPQVDWIGVGFGATPELIDFWERNGFGTIHLATTRHESSGEYSILMLDPTSDRGAALSAYHSGWFARRILDMLGDVLTDMDPDVVRAALQACTTRYPLDLDIEDWRLIVSAAYGPALYSVDPSPFRRLTMHALTDERTPLTPDQERLLVRKLLQLRPWSEVTEELEYVSTSEAMRSLGRAVQPLIDEYAPAIALTELNRYRET
jgi:tRNA(Met) cytidine acetyltransferase